jgi:glutathione synthase/RimK-type ligase-like ATP-grasp enzyme
MAAIQPEAYIGIMANESEGTPPFGERYYYARLCKLGRSLGLTVYVFSPLRVDPVTRTVKGYTYSVSSDCWEEHSYPLPHLIYDRSFFVRQSDYTRHRSAVRRLHELKPIPYLGHGLKSKWEALVYLKRDPELRPYLPRTAKLVRPELVMEWLTGAGRVFLKPLSGSQGKGTAMIESSPGGFRIEARDGMNRPLSRILHNPTELAGWIRTFTGKRSYLIQQYLSLQSSDGETWDVRSLVQKNGRGMWELTGMAVRKGSRGSITSNIHGGGSAVEVLPFLEQQFGQAKAAAILERLHFLSGRIPPVLEASNGRMVELGIDLGVDRDGNVWIIEVNTKPGRTVFQRLHQEDAGYRAARNPLAYAKHLLRRSAPVSSGQLQGTSRE